MVEKETPLSARISGNRNHTMVVMRKLSSSLQCLIAPLFPEDSEREDCCCSAAYAVCAACLTISSTMIRTWRLISGTAVDSSSSPRRNVPIVNRSW